jgi:hypothetical protein
LSTVGHSVFVAPRDLPPGTRWPEEIRAALSASLVIVVLISAHYESAYYLKEEVLAAVELLRHDRRRRLVPVYLSPNRCFASPPLIQLQSLSLPNDDALLEVAHQLQGVIRRLRREATWDAIFGAKSIAIVTGCDYLPEKFDRPLAYHLQRLIDRAPSSLEDAFLRSVVFGDTWFLGGNLSDHSNVISIGSAGVNRLSGIIAASGDLVRSSADGKWRVMRERRRWAVFGVLAEDTRAAVESFEKQDLSSFLAEVWGSDQ